MTTLKPPKGILLIVTGAAGTGKGMVNGMLLRDYPNFAFSVSATTRAPRPGEVDGREYHFLTREQFEEQIKNDGLIEYTEYCGNYYGTLKSELHKLDEGKNLILEIETDGGMNVKRLYPDSVAVFILPPDYDTLKSRLVNRGTNTPEDIENRMKRALEEFKFVEKYDYAVVNHNDKADEAAKAIYEIVMGEQHRVSRNKGAVEKIFFGK